MQKRLRLILLAFFLWTSFTSTYAQAPAAQPAQPEFAKKGQQLMREGKIEEALALFRQTLETSPLSLEANLGAGIVLDLMGQGEDARKYFAKAIDVADTAERKATSQRAMAMSYAFEGNCKKTIEFEEKVIQYDVSINNFYQQGEIADEAARVCIDSGDLDSAEHWYKSGHDLGLKEPGIKPERQDLWEFRWEHAQARIAARRGNLLEAQKHVTAAKALFDKGSNPEQAPFVPYLLGYVAFYAGDYPAALESLQKANQNDPFIVCLLAQTYEKLANKGKALEFYRKASTATAHNPPAACAVPFSRKKLAQLAN
ncbi:MAG TPA: tetratricopeptide repeat protein [Candidatus Acidoferrum sp.]|jgi:tetratricopeptide (TPR) repeat protein|nr:tetratricopeptide repeat protein [Candidatus Acidoferrum sp.]